MWQSSSEGFYENQDPQQGDMNLRGKFPPLSSYDQADALAAILRHLELRSLHAIVGASYGGMVAQAYALKYEPSLSHLVLANTLHGGEMWQKGNNDTWTLQLANQMPELWDQLKTIRASGYLSCSPEYQKAQGMAPAGLSYYYNPSNQNRPGDGTGRSRRPAP